MNSEDSLKYIDSVPIELFEIFPDAIVVLNERGNIVYTNDKIASLFGYKKNELIGLPIEELVPEKVCQKNQTDCLDVIRNHSAGKISDKIQKIIGVDKEKNQILIEIHLHSFLIGNKLFVLLIIRNDAEKNLAEKEFKTLLNSSPDAMMIVSATGNMEMVNRQLLDLFEMKQSELVKQSISSLVQQKVMDQINLYQENSLMEDKIQGITNRIEFVAQTNKGRKIPVQISVKPIENKEGTFFSAVLKDLSAEKAIEKELKESEKRFSSLVDNAFDSIITLSIEGHILSYNKASERIFGYSAKSMIQNNFKLLLEDSSSVQLFFDFAQDAIEKKSERNKGIQSELLCKRASGIPFEADISLSLMTLKDKPLLIWITRDVSERKKLDRLKKEFVSIVSHELRTPVTSIRGAVGLLIGGKYGLLTEEGVKLLDIAARNSDRLSALINDILDVEKIEVGKMDYQMKYLNISPLIAQIIAINQPYAEKYLVTLSLIEPIPSIIVFVDPNRLIQAVTNLLSNAIKFSPMNGVVTICLELSSQLVKILIKDEGPGLPKDSHEYLFQPFSQVDSSDQRKKGGSGLGLFISKLIIDRFNGKIGFDSILGEGATFYISLPTFEGEKWK